MRWSYGVTTVPERIHDGLLERTVRSLAAAGFDKPIIFVDGMSPGDWENSTGALGQLDVTIHKNKIRAFGNWMCALLELFAKEPNADRFAVFQDDFVASKNMRQYLEKCEMPKQGYWNLYTFRMNERPTLGWYEAPHQLGKGAVGLVFSNTGARTLLSQQYMVDRFMNSTRGHRAIDGGVISAFKQIGWKEYVHNPSLLQHTGDKSVIGNRKHEHAPSFRGEDFDAVQLLGETGNLPDPNKFRLGMVCYVDDPMAHEIAKNTDVEICLVRPRGNVMRGEVMLDTPFVYSIHGAEHHIREFHQQCDVVILLDDSPGFLKQRLPAMSKEQNKRVVGVTRQTEPEEWMGSMDLLICCSVESYNALGKTFPCAEFAWPTRWETGANMEFNLLARSGEHRMVLPIE